MIPWKLIGRIAVPIIVLIGIWYAIHSYGERRYEAGEAHVMAQWKADTAARDKATADAIAKAEADKLAALQNNARVTEDANAKLAAIAADRDSLDGLLREARDQVRRLASAEAGNRLGADVIAGIAARAAEVDRRLVDYDAACRADAIRFQALQDQIRPQL